MYIYAQEKYAPKKEKERIIKKWSKRQEIRFLV